MNSNYIYVDVTRSFDDTNTKWKRLKLTDIKRFQYDEAKNFNCFATIQRFISDEKTEEEQYVAPLWLDIDNEEEIAAAHKEAKTIVDMLVNDLEITPQSLKIAYSGSKGFHIMVPEIVMHIKPANDLHKTFKLIAQYIRMKVAQKNETSCLDLNVYNNRRMIRLTNSIHQKTKNHKISLSYDELMNLQIDDIVQLAKTERPIVTTTPVYSKKAADLYKFYTSQKDFLANQTQENLGTFSFKKGEYPVCVAEVLEYGWKKDGDRNYATVNLATFFKEAGYTQDEAADELIPWVKKFTSAKSPSDVAMRVQSTKNVISAVYSIESYKFGCAMIRSLHSEKDESGNYDRIPCAGLLCSYLITNDTEKNDAINVRLNKAGHSAYYGKLIKTNVMVAGKKDTPYIIPFKIEYSCYGKCKKPGCPLYSAKNRTLYRNLQCNDKVLLKMCNIPHNILTGILHDLSGIHNCTKFKYEVIDTINIYEMLAIPMVEDEETYDDENYNYTIRKVYSVGNLDITENKYYQLHGYVFPNPKNQEGTILVQKSVALQDVIERFEYNSDIEEQLANFQPVDMSLEEITDKIGQILHDLTYNVTGIVERDDVLLAILLVYHSALRIKVPWDTSPIRGWLESVIIGDTGTGKSHLVDKLLKFIGLGTRVNAESTSRTGLTYKMEQYNNSSWFIQWGAWPLSDRELIWIDECSAIPKEEYGHMTLARSEGKLEVKRAVTAETKCRVRAILTGNAPKGKRLTGYTHGAESLVDIFNNEDIRRFDFAVFLRATDVNPAMYNKKLETYPIRHTREMLKHNILFAWSRTAEHIIIEKDTIDAVYQFSTKLSEAYGNVTTVPLVSPADQRNKVVRLATAAAILTHSTSNEYVHVKPAHVEFIFNYLLAIYDSQACGLNYYNKLVTKEEQINEDKFEKIKLYVGIHNPRFKADYDFNNMIVMFAKQHNMNLTDLEAMLNIHKEEAKALTQSLTKAGLLQRTSFGFKKTARFNFFINKFCELGLLDKDDDVIDIY